MKESTLNPQIRLSIRRLTLSLLIALISLIAKGQGLGFNGMESPIAERTSLDVLDSKVLGFSEKIEIDFAMKFFHEEQLGYILRLKSHDSERIWNFSVEEKDDSYLFQLNKEGHYSVIKAEMSKQDIQKFKWFPVRLIFDMKNQEITLVVKHLRYTSKEEAFPELEHPIILFGKSDHMIDVPTFAIKELHIKDINRDIYFKLDEYEGEVTYDINWNFRGHSENPIWMINQNTTWTPLCEFSSNPVAGSNYNAVRKEIYYFNTKEITIYKISTGKIRRIHLAQDLPVAMKLGNNFISPDGKYLYCYELHNEFKQAQDPSVARLNLDDFHFDVISSENLNYPHHHHCCFYNTKKEEYTIFGGFGDMRYNGIFYSLRNGGWEITWPENPPKIHPRYFTCAGTDENFAYILGGMGNESGEQIVGRQYFYDLHKVNLLTGDSEMLWNLDWNSEDIVPVRNMFISKGKIFTLCYPEYISTSHLQLYEISINDGSFRPVANTIPIVSNKMRTNANIYYDVDFKMFFALVQEFEDDIKSTLKVYTLSSPAMNEDELKTIPTKIKYKYLDLGIASGILLLIGIIFATMYYKKKKKILLKQWETTRGKLYKQTERKNSILLFGDFTVIDKDGNNISNIFTLQQRTILCLLVKYNHNGGISTERISQLLWPDKDEEKVKNSRGVAMNNLRKSLKDLEGIKIEFTEGKYKLVFTSEFYCDYLILREELENKNRDTEKVLDILSSGKFLKLMNDPIFDTFKEDTENSISPLLDNELQVQYQKKEYQGVVEIAQMISHIDPLNENALELSIHALKKLKRTEDALVCYATFCAEYKKTYDTEYPKKFNNIS